MAYAREEKENIEVDYSISKLWEKLPKAIEQLEWTIQESNKDTHHLAIKTKGAFLSYPSTMKIDLVEVDEKTSKMLISAETPVTTITSVADFGRTRERIEQLIVKLAKIMENKK